jgi:O-antigen/teichoic acid export membrane protein
MVALGVAAALTITYFSSWGIEIIFGQEFRDAGDVLAIYSWIGIFGAFAWVGERYLVIEGLQKLILYRHLLGAVLNVVANYFVIPRFGISGAAWASLASMAVANYLVDALDSRSRIMFVQKSRALLFLWMFTPLFRRAFLPATRT